MHLSQWMNADTLLLSKSIFYLDFLVCFYLTSSFHSKTPLGTLHCITLSCLLRLLSVVTVPCFWQPGWFWGVLVSGLVVCPSTGIFLMFFSWRDRELRALGGKVPFFSHPVKGNIHTVNTTHRCWCWPWTTGWGCVRKGSSSTFTLWSQEGSLREGVGSYTRPLEHYIIF